MNFSHLKQWSSRLLQLPPRQPKRPHGDAAAGWRTAEFSRVERRFMLESARRALITAAEGGCVPEVQDVPPTLFQERACFVTLTKSGALRGCVGHIFPQSPLWLAVMNNARSAALRDPRFPEVEPDEVPHIEIEISVLTTPRPLEFSSADDLLAQLRPGEDGVLLQAGPRMGTFLPQVWAQIPSKTDFMDHLALKAGCLPGEWRHPDVTISVYQAESFHESELAAAPALHAG